jgi:tetratricopeptide (TPR) repeat protein
LTSTTDDRGRFSIIGMKVGSWTFTANLPGYVPDSVKVAVKTLGTNPQVDFKLVKGSGAGFALAGVDTKLVGAELEAANGFYNAGQYDQAIAAYQAILAKTPALTLIHLQIGNAYRAKKDYDKAIASFQEVLKEDPANESAKIAIGMANLEKGDLPAAEAALLAAAESGGSREVLYNLGEVKFAKNEPDEAAKYYQKAADMDPGWGKPLFKLGLVALNKGDKATTVTYMEKVIAVDPNSAEAAQAKALIPQLK